MLAGNECKSKLTCGKTEINTHENGIFTPLEMELTQEFLTCYKTDCTRNDTWQKSFKEIEKKNPPPNDDDDSICGRNAKSLNAQ